MATVDHQPGSTAIGQGGGGDPPGRLPHKPTGGCNTPGTNKGRRTIGGIEIQGDSDDDDDVPQRVRFPCLPCVKACASRGRIDCAPGKGRSCTACNTSKRTCEMAPQLYAHHAALRRAVRNYMRFANAKNAKPYIKKGKGVKAKDFGVEFNELRTAYEEALDAAQAAGFRNVASGSPSALVPYTPSRGRNDASQLAFQAFSHLSAQQAESNRLLREVLADRYGPTRRQLDFNREPGRIQDAPRRSRSPVVDEPDSEEERLAEALRRHRERRRRD